MFLRTITLRQFRNHKELQLEVESGVNLLIGSNGAGKTNVIEAIAVLTTGFSPRGAEPETLVEWNQEGFFIKGDFHYEEEGFDPLSLEMKYRLGSVRVVRQNGKIPVKLRDLMGRVPLVSFVPEDLALVKGEPELRRRAMNMILCQVDPMYSAVLRKYSEAVKSRNAALRQLAEGVIGKEALVPWNQAVVEQGLILCRKRAEFLEEFSIRVSKIQERISDHQENVSLEYKPSFIGPWNETAGARWFEEMNRCEAQELAMGSTVMGPHRDDVLFLMNGRAARQFSSEGQKRTTAVAFKLAEIPYVEEKLGQKPICLLDDVLSELDAKRAAHLLEELSRTGQCFVTMTGLESWPRERDLPAAVFRVDSSGVKREEIYA
ncbi:MAG: DNA replication and repair protein RecF [Elusimicrobia bacterium]|nr:DNA replication and repair protein RecF [Elusimicrobiota bacterium]